MNSTSQNYNNNRKPKNPIKFKIQLNEEQKQAKSRILLNDITVLKGGAGSGKTLLACQIGLDLLFTKQVEKIIITRPTVSKEEIGFLPGDIKEKMDPWLAPIYQNMYNLYTKSKIDKHLENNDIEILPLAFIRGVTFTNTLVIVDEAQNLTHSQMESVFTRLGINSKLIVCGDLAQNDLKYKKDSAFGFLPNLESIPGFEIIKLQANHRHNIVKPILEIYEKYRD